MIIGGQQKSEMSEEEARGSSEVEIRRDSIIEEQVIHLV